MRILIVAHSFYKYHFGGAEYQLLLMAKHFIEKRHQVYYIFLTENPAKVPSQIDGINLFPIKKKMKLSKLLGKTYIVYKNEIFTYLIVWCIYTHTQK